MLFRSLVAAGTSALVGSAASAAPQDSQVTAKPVDYTADNTPSFAGTTDPNAVVQVEIDRSGVMSDAGVADETGAWSYEVPSAMADGEHSFQFRFGDTWTVDAGSFVIDTVAPAVPKWLAAPESIDGGAIFTLQEDPADPGLAYYFAIDRGAWETTPGNPQIPSWAVNVGDGVHVIKARAVDKAGNVSQEVTKRFTNVSHEHGIHLVSAPDAVSFVAEPTFKFVDDGTNTWKYTINGAGPISFTGGTVTLPPLVPGDYLLEVATVGQYGTHKYSYMWTVKPASAAPPVVRFVSGPMPSAPTVVREARFEFAADKPVTTWMYSFDGGDPVVFSDGVFTLTQQIGRAHV